MRVNDVCIVEIDQYTAKAALVSLLFHIFKDPVQHKNTKLNPVI